MVEELEVVVMVAVAVAAIRVVVRAMLAEGGDDGQCDRSGGDG